MIRIDLSKDEVQKSKRSLKSQIFTKLKLSRLNGAQPGQAGAQPLDVATLVTFVIASAAAFLPSLFVGQYKQYVMNENEEQIKSIRESVGQVNQEIVKLTPYQKELESYEVQKKLVKQRLGVIRQLLAVRGTPVNVLDAIGQSLPTRTWINDLELTNDKDGSSVVTLAGLSMSNEEISDFIDKLSESVYFNDVSLEDVAATKGENNIDVKSFRMTAHPKYRLVAPKASDLVGDSAAAALAGQSPDVQGGGGRMPAAGGDKK